MNQEQYSLTASASQMIYKFISEGPRGEIKKVVQYSKIESEGFPYYNLAFGDYNEETGELDDISKSNNGDRNKILATVAATVLKFTECFPDVVIYATGSNQMAITANYEDICQVLHVYGVIYNKWYLFKKNVNYDGFGVFRK